MKTARLSKPLYQHIGVVIINAENKSSLTVNMQHFSKCLCEPCYRLYCRMDMYLLAIQPQECELSHIVSCHEHLSAYRHIYTAVPVTKTKQRKRFIYCI